MTVSCQPCNQKRLRRLRGWRSHQTWIGQRCRRVSSAGSQTENAHLVTRRPCSERVHVVSAGSIERKLSKHACLHSLLTSVKGATRVKDGRKVKGGTGEKRGKAQAKEGGKKMLMAARSICFVSVSSTDEGRKTSGGSCYWHEGYCVCVCMTCHETRNEVVGYPTF